MKSLPRVSFATTNQELEENRERVTGNTYTMFRYIEEGEVHITLDGGEKIRATKGEYVITPAGIAYDYYSPRGTISSMFSFYLDVGEEALIDREEIEFEHYDNYTYVGIESVFIPIKGKITLSGKAYQAMKQLIGNYDADMEYVNVMASAKVIEVFMSLAERSIKDILKANADVDMHEGGYLYCERIDKYIEKNYMYPITMTTISRLLVKHENYISRIYKSVRGITVMNHLQNVRIENAKQLLISGKYSVAEVAKMVGYPDSKYFITVFKKIESISPGKYRESMFTERTFSYDIPKFIDEE
jgi:AraC-like DNA-binding protein